MNAAEFSKMLQASKAEIDTAMAEWLRCIEDDAIADEEARKAKARAWVEIKVANPKATVPVVEAMVDLETSNLQMKARHAEGLRRAAQGAFDAKKQFLSALQSLASLSKSEAQLAKWESSEVA